MQFGGQYETKGTVAQTSIHVEACVPAKLYTKCDSWDNLFEDKHYFWTDKN